MGWRGGAPVHKTTGAVGCIDSDACLRACLFYLSRHRRRHVKTDRLSEAVILSTGTPIPAQWTCRRRRRYRADIEPKCDGGGRREDHLARLRRAAARSGRRRQGGGRRRSEGPAAIRRIM